jgi:hypothetical protein
MRFGVPRLCLFGNLGTSGLGIRFEFVLVLSLRLLRHCPALSRGVSLGARALTEHNFMYLCIQIC